MIPTLEDTRWNTWLLKKPCLASFTKLSAALGASERSSSITISPLVVWIDAKLFVSLPPLLRSCSTMNSTTSGTARIATLRPVRSCLRRLVAASSAWRRASRLRRWRSRFDCFDTGRESTSQPRQLALGRPRTRCTVPFVGLLVQKYGGTSVADADRIKSVAEHIVRTRGQGDDVVVVVSAMGKTTDDLERLAHGVSHAPSAREMDMLLTAGERISMSLL